MAAFLKLDDIKGEIVLDTTPPELVTVCLRDDAGFKDDALTNGGTYDGGGGQYVSSYSEDGANSFTTGGGGDSLTDAGLGNNSFHQGADVLTKVSYTTDRNGVWDDPTTWSGASASVISEACTPTCPTGFAEDALVQQVNGTIGYEMQAGMGISANARGKTTGTIAAYNVMGSGVPVENYCTGYCFEGGSSEQGSIFAPVNVLRSDNHF